MKAREPRQGVILSVRIRQDEKWMDATIRNVSSRGIMLHMDDPPPTGSFIEIRKQSAIIIGQVRWTEGNRCGLRTQDRVPIDYLKSNTGSPNAPRANAEGAVERRAAVRVLSPEEAAERSRIKSMLLQKVIVAAAGIAGAIFIATLMYDVISKPIAQVVRHLG